MSSTAFTSDNYKTAAKIRKGEPLLNSGYICPMSAVLSNPVYQALISGDKQLSRGTETVKFFDEAVSPFAGFEEGYTKGFDDLFDLLPAGRFILYAIPVDIPQPRGWQLIEKVNGVQMVFSRQNAQMPTATLKLVSLQEQHVSQMMALAKLTRPGPFGLKTIAFGHYYGIIDNDKLVAMTGQRLHVAQFTEVSAVCTHPDYVGKGYASALLQHQVNLILQQGQTPFLHVRKDNQRAIDIYLRMGFTISRPMNFYFMKREAEE